MMRDNPTPIDDEAEPIDAVLQRIVDPEVRAFLIDLIHALEASQGNQLSRRRRSSEG